MGEPKTMANEELMNVNPQVAESEPTTIGEYQYGQDQFNVFRQVDQAEMEGQQVEDNSATNANADNQQNVNPTENQNGNLPQSDNSQSDQQNFDASTDNNSYSQNEENYRNAYNQGYSQADIDRIVEKAKRQEEEVETYRKFFASKLGSKALEQAERIAGQAKGKQEQSQSPSYGDDEDFRKSASDAWGINEDDPFYSQFDKKVERMLDKKLAGQAQFIQQLQAEREQAFADNMSNAYCQHLINDYGMPEIVAKQATMKASRLANEKCGDKFDPRTFYQALRTFEMDEIIPVSRDIENKKFKAMREELEQYRSGQANANNNIQPNGNNNGSSTSVAADRMLNQQNANYKASGNIPNGGAVLDGYDEGDDIRNFVAFGNKHFLG